MACLREQAVDGRVGVVSCDEEGCLYRLITLNHDPLFAEHTSEADCILQLRLRAGDAQNSVVDPDAWKREREGNWTPIKPVCYLGGFNTPCADTTGCKNPVCARLGRKALGLPAESGGDEFKGKRRLVRGEIENLLNQKLTDWQWARISDLVWFRAGDAPGESLGVDTNEVRFLGDASSPYRRSGRNELGESVELPAESGGDGGEREFDWAEEYDASPPDDTSYQFALTPKERYEVKRIIREEIRAAYEEEFFGED